MHYFVVNVLLVNNNAHRIITACLIPCDYWLSLIGTNSNFSFYHVVVKFSSSFYLFSMVCYFDGSLQLYFNISLFLVSFFVGYSFNTSGSFLLFSVCQFVFSLFLSVASPAKCLSVFDEFRSVPLKSINSF